MTNSRDRIRNGGLVDNHKRVLNNTFPDPQDDGWVPPSALDKQEGGDHYKDMKIQPAEFARANGLLGLESSVIRYTCRHQKKNGAEDIKKAIHCLELILELDYGS